MDNFDRYLEQLNKDVGTSQPSTTGYFNFMEDRFLIMTKWKTGMKRCINIPHDNNPKGLIAMYNCQTKICSDALQHIEQAKAKCEHTKYPDKCEELYSRMIGPLEAKIKFNRNQIPTIQRKSGMVKY